MYQKAIELLEENSHILRAIYDEKEIPMPDDLEKLSSNNAQAVTLLKQQPAADFTKKFHELIKLSEEHLSDNKIGRLQTYGKEACKRLDRAASTKKDLLEACGYSHILLSKGIGQTTHAIAMLEAAIDKAEKEEVTK